MKALVYNGSRDVSVDEVPDARLERPTDVLVRVTTTNICGSDLHMYEGRTELEPGKILGHENLGVVTEAGSGVERIGVGDRVCLPFNIACGFCRNCESGMPSYCLTANPDPEMAGAAYGFVGMGPYSGGQAEYLRVPFADYNCLRLPEDAEDKEDDYVMVADVFPTGWHATRLAGLRAGESCAVYGAGPVGLMAAYSALLQGASQVMVVDRHPDRLLLVEEMGAIPVDDSKGDPVEQIHDLTEGRRADCGCECVGYHAHDHLGTEHPEMTMNKLVQSVKFTGGIGVVGAFLPSDPGASDEMAQNGRLPFEMGTFWFQGQRIGTGQAPVKVYNRQLRDLIHHDRAKPSFIVSHDLPLEDAPDAYKHFDKREDGWTKVVLKPGRS